MIDEARAFLYARRATLAARFQWLRIALETLQADRRMVGSVMAAGVAFRLFLMILPLALLTAALLGFEGSTSLGSPGQVAGQYGITLALARTINSSAREATQGRWILLGTGLVLLLWTGNGVVQALNGAFRVAWNLDRTGRSSPLRAIIIVGSLVVAVAATMATASIGAGSAALEVPMTAGLAVGYAFDWYVISWALPHASGNWRALVPGSILMALGFSALHLGTVLFVADRVARASQLYGSLGFVSTLMLWLFLSGRIMVGSAQLNAALWHQRGGAKRLTTFDPE
ncbi:MAG: YihY/virulence factor BrkB family protein [Chloroflexi bacterium]|nr:MAG: YihY/virulence factor BrkB family protein [Chloroflexota bacterium]